MCKNLFYVAILCLCLFLAPNVFGETESDLIKNAICRYKTYSTFDIKYTSRYRGILGGIHLSWDYYFGKSNQKKLAGNYLVAYQLVYYEMISESEMLGNPTKKWFIDRLLKEHYGDIPSLHWVYFRKDYGKINSRADKIVKQTNISCS